MNRTEVIREFDKISFGSDEESQKKFKALQKFLLELSGVADADVKNCIRVEMRYGETFFTAKNYVGLIQVNDDFQIEILPKIDLGGGDNRNEDTKKIFLKMLRSMKDFPSRIFNNASLKIERMNIYEIFINMYLQEVMELVKHGLRSSYVNLEDNLNFYKGKLVVNQHIKANLAHQERFYVAFDMFHHDRPENRLVKATLEILSKRTHSAENSKIIRQLLTIFDLVKSSTNYERDFSKVVLDRSTRDYEYLMQWAKVFLLNKSFSTFSGITTSKALLFPMQSVYERYVAQQIKRVFVPKGWEVITQKVEKYLSEAPEVFQLKPDIVLKRRNGNTIITIIMDTKWKETNLSNKNCGISQGDMYQMYAYSKKYKAQNVWLLYPITEEIRKYGEEKDKIKFVSETDKNESDRTTIRVHFIDFKDTLTDDLNANLEELAKKIKSTS